MVKITSSTIDIYTVVPNTAPLQRRQINMAAQQQQQQQQKQTPSTTNLRRKEYRQHQQTTNDFSTETNEYFYDSSDSETSFFDDSDDNDDVTTFFGRHAQNYQNLRNGEEYSHQTQQQRQHQYKNRRDIVKSCEILASPRTERKTNNNNKIMKSSQTTSRMQTNMEDLGFRPPSRNYSVPNLSSWNSKKVVDEDTASFTPHLKRKQTTDITKSAAFKEIYAHNLRLYSKVLAKVRNIILFYTIIFYLFLY